VTDAGEQDRFPTITVERLRDGYVLVDRAGAISTPTPMSEAAARRFCRALGIDWPFDEPAVTADAGDLARAVRSPECTSGDGAQAFQAVAGELAEQVRVWRRILREHVRTDDGYCAHPHCGRPGYGTPHVPHPCSARVLATLARDLHRARTDELPAPLRSDPHD
jgi:hypothetical protein